MSNTNRSSRRIRAPRASTLSLVSGALLTLGLGAALAACGGTQTGGEGQPTTIAGRWTSDCVVASPQQVFKLAFEMDAATWKLDYQAFGDATCTSKFLTVHIEGPYQLTSPSTTVANAWNARFGFASKQVTPHSEAAAGFLASAAGCGRSGFAAEVATDILEAGCAGLGSYPMASCPAELDLAWREGDTLRLGARPADGNLCSEARRPAELSPVALHKQP